MKRRLDRNYVAVRTILQHCMGQKDCDDLNLLLREIHDWLFRKNDKADISAFFPRAFFPTPWACSLDIFSLESLDGQRSVIMYIYMLRITYTYVVS